MSHFKSAKIASVAIALIVAVSFITTSAAAEVVKVEGLIKSRSGEQIVLQTADNPNLVVLLTDYTECGQVQGVLKARRKEMSMAALVPGLKIKVEGTKDSEGKLTAEKVSFKGDDLQQAQAIQAGMHETKMQGEQNAAELEKHNAELKAQNAALQQHQEQISANKAAVDAAVARFGQLDDYYIFDEVTVYFANGKVTVDPKYNAQLMALADKAKGINGYMVEVKGYASSVGSVAVNQKLSEDRANAVTNILLQQGHVPLTRMLAPGAMGESEQVGDDKTADGQAENRRVVVRVLQNKAIAGI
jgi:OmpA-OmpF porin, OOP family